MDPKFFRKYADIIAEAERPIDEGIVDTIKEKISSFISNLSTKFPAIKQTLPIAQKLQPEITEILKTSKSGKEIVQRLQQLAQQQAGSVAMSEVKDYPYVNAAIMTHGGSVLTSIALAAAGIFQLALQGNPGAIGLLLLNLATHLIAVSLLFVKH